MVDISWIFARHLDPLKGNNGLHCIQSYGQWLFHQPAKIPFRLIERSIMKIPMSLITLALVCSALPAQEKSAGVSLGVSVGFHSLNSTSDGLNLSTAGVTGTGSSGSAEFGMDLHFIHSERFSTRWGMTYATGQKVNLVRANFPGNATSFPNLDRTCFGVYIMGDLNIINGVGQNLYLTAGPVYNMYRIAQSGLSSSVNLDKTNKAGFIGGLGLSFNGSTMRWTPELLLQKVGTETTRIIRLHIQFQF